MTAGPMRLTDWVRTRRAAELRGPLAVILVGGPALVTETLAHHIRLGFPRIIAVSESPIPADSIPDGAPVTVLTHPVATDEAALGAVAAIARAVPAGTWLHVGRSAEFLFYPFAEARPVAALLDFHAEERRDAMSGVLIDLYPGDRAAAPGGWSMDDAWLDRDAYAARARTGADGAPADRQLDLWGGLRWRRGAHVPAGRRRIDRVPLWRTARGRRLLADHRLSDAEGNTWRCPWHANLTCAVVSFRLAIALSVNPAASEAIGQFRWPGSVPFDWTSAQLTELGLMAPGQWF